MSRLLLVDGHSLLFRAYHAMPPLSRSDGQPTGALHGFANMLLRVIAEERPEQVAVVFDTPHPTFRHATYEAYKANREEAPDDFRSQVPLAHRLLDAMEIPRYEAPGFEADDIIGTLARRAEEEDWDVEILTGDRDLLQLVNAHTIVLLTSRTGISDMDRLDTEGVIKKMGVPPRLVPDLKGLMGDASDNIPGVAGIGSKSAVQLIAEYGSVDDIYRRLEDITNPRWKRSLAGSEAAARESRDLATIDCTVPVDWAPSDSPYTLTLTDVLRQCLTELEFHSLLKRLGGGDAALPAEPSSESARVEVAAGPLTEWPLSASSLALVPVEGGWWVGGVANDNRPWAGWWPGRLPERPSHQAWVGWDIKPSWRRAWQDGDEPTPFTDDGCLATYLLHPDRGKYPLREILADVGIPSAAAEDPAVACGGLALLEERQHRELEAQHLSPLYRDVEMPLTRVLAKMEAWGMVVDRSHLEALGEGLDEQIANTMTEVYHLADCTFNINSPSQLGEVLFDRLGLPALKRTKTGYSTDAEVLEQLAPLHPVVEKVLLFRQLVKLKGTYVDGLLPLIDGDGRLHTTFHQTGTATGRLSSSDPNLQNIPVRLPLGRKIREVFRPSSGRLLVSADYSQIELRLLAHLSGDQGLVQAFVAGEDIHRRTASEIFGIPMEAVDATWRSRAKAVNFGIVYGISDYGLARDTGVSRREAGDYIARYFERYPALKHYLDSLIATARDNGYATTILGRRRPLPDINTKNRVRRQYAERMAMNSVIQGSAADLIKVAMVRLDDAFAQEGLQSRLLLQVHDELIWDVLPEEAGAVARLAQEIMPRALEVDVPLDVEFKRGETWGTLVPWHPGSAGEEAWDVAGTS